MQNFRINFFCIVGQVNSQIIVEIELKEIRFECSNRISFNSKDYLPNKEEIYFMFFHLLLFVSFSKIFKDRNLSISTNGNWPNTPLLAEASTFIADVDGEAFWTFLRGLQKFTDEKSNQKSKSHIPQTIEEIKSYSLDFLSEEQRYLLELSLLTRSHN